MKQLEIPNGGMPFTGDDLLWMQSGIIEAMKGIAYGLAGEQNAILSGLDVTINGADWDISEGFMFLDGEVCYFAGGTAQNVQQDISRHGIRITNSYDSAGNEVFADSQSKDTYLVRKAELVLYTVPPTYNAQTDILFEDFPERRVGVNISYAPVGYNPAISTFGQITAHKVNNKVTIFGKITQGIIANGELEHILQIPAGYEPSSRISFMCAFQDIDLVTRSNFIESFWHAKVMTDGKVYGHHARSNNITDAALGPITVSFSYLV